MSKSKLCLLIVTVLVIAIGVTTAFSVASAAVDDDRYIEADISLSADSIYGESIVAKADYWTSVDKKIWERAVDFDPDWCDVVYFNAEDNTEIGLTAPQAVGKYYARVIVNGNYDRNNYFFGKTKLAKDTVLASFSYQIAYENVAVVFAPNKQVDYFADRDYYSEAVNDTKVYYKGKALTKDADYTVTVSENVDGIYTEVTEAINPGEYKVTLTLKNLYENANIVSDSDRTFTSVFNIVNSVANVVRLSDSKIYEGMYQSDSAKASDYYTVKYQGLLTTESVFFNAYSVSYVQNNQILSYLPKKAGNYSVRFTFVVDIDSYGISEGDFIDLDYVIYEKPYEVTYDNTAVSSDGYSLIYQGRPILITPSFDRDLSIDSKKTKYYRYTDDTTVRELSYGEYPTAVGRYRAVFYIDVSGGNVTGSSMFGVDDKDYVIDETNNVLQYEFQIIPRMSVNFISDYQTNDSEYAAIVDYTGKPASIVSALKDSTLADIPTEIYSITYYDLNWNVSSAIEPGVYHAVVTFDSASESGKWTNGETEIEDGTKLYYDFKVLSLRPTITASKINNGIILGFGNREVNASDYTVKYFRYENVLNYKSSQSELINQVGKYHIVVYFSKDNFDLGISAGDIFVIDYENVSEGSLENVKLLLDNAFDSGNGMKIAYDGNVKVADVRFEGVNDAARESLNYSLYYQKLNRNGDAALSSDWNVCDYPKMPGTYRAVFVVNEDNVAFNAKSGDSLVYEFTIESLVLTPSFTVKVDERTKDLVYDNNPDGKDFNVSFTVNGRKTTIDENAYTLRFATINDGIVSTFGSDKPVDAGNYVIAVYFKYSLSGEYDKYGIYTDEPTIINPDDFTAENMATRSVFSGVITVEKLALTIVARIPVEEKGMYKLAGGEVTPSYTFYKTNGFTGNISELTDDRKLTYISIDGFDYELFTGSFNSISCDAKVDEAIETGRYVNNLSLKESFRKNIVIDQVSYSLDGEKNGENYNSQIYFATKRADDRFTVGYRISPLPLIVNSTALESIAENSYEDHYYGNTSPVSVDGLIFSTVDENGNKYDIGSKYAAIRDNLASYVSLRYYKRLTGETTTEANPIQAIDSDGNLTYDLASITGYLFAAGDYSLRLSFDNTSAKEYDYFTLVDGKDENGMDMNGNEIEKGAFTDIRFTVKSANVLRVVFERNFNSFVYDAEEKAFTVRFMSGNAEVNLPYTLTKYRVVNGIEEVNTDSAFPKAVGRYALQVRFESDIYKYKIQQENNSGVYSGSSEYINNQSTVKFYYSITNPQYLAWNFIQNGKITVAGANQYGYEFNGYGKEFRIEFFNANNPDLTVNLIPNVDYVVWYYTKNANSENYVKLLSVPTETGSYVAELVFLRTLYDYKINDEIGYPYGYEDARNESGRFGLSLSDSANNELSLNMINEKRFVKFDIVPSKVTVNGVSVSDKEFDNGYDAVLGGKWNATVTDDGRLIDAAKDLILSLLSDRTFAKFETASVGNVSVDLYLKLTETVCIKLPALRYTSEVSAYEFVLKQIEEIKASENYANQELKNAVEELESKLAILYTNYDVTFEDVNANITKRTVVVKPDAFSREFDPFYKDSDNLTFSYKDDLLALLTSNGNPFVGALERESGDTINGVGQYRIILGTLSLGNTSFTLVSGETTTAFDCFKLKLDDRSVYYTITKRAITVTVTEGLSKYYDQDDPDFVCEVVSGNLINGDKLLFDGEHKPVRQTNKDRDDVGVYQIDMSPVTIVDSSGTDISDNYKISYVKQTFTILPKEIFIIPTDYDKAKYTDNFYALYALNALEKRYSVREDKNGLLRDYTFNEGYSLTGNFGLEQIANADSSVTAKYKITLGNIGVADANGKNVTSNYVLSSNTTAYYTIIKTNVVFELVDPVVKKSFASDDPVIKIRQLKDYPLPAGYSLREDSSAVREEGENVGVYKIKTRDASKIYIVDDATGEVVTKYFNVIIRNNTSESYPEGTQFVIEKYRLFVSVKEMTFVKGNSTIIGELVFKDSDGRNVSQRILDKLSVSFDPVILDKPVEGVNAVQPTYSSDSIEDPNFEIVTERGVITVIFPENNVTYKNIDKDEKVMQANAFILVKGMLLETKQMYLASTDNGQDPTKMITITLPINDDLIGKKIFVVAVRKDGKYEILQADVINGAVVVTDNEFNYIMLCESKSWPIIVIIAVVVIILLGVAGFVFAKLRRRKKRNGEKPVNFRRRAKEIVKDDGESVSGYKPNENATVEDELGDISELDVSSDISETPKGVDEETKAVDEPKIDESKGGKKKKEKRAKPEKDANKTVLSGAMPKQPEVNDAPFSEIKPSIDKSDEIIIATDRTKGEDAIEKGVINPSSENIESPITSNESVNPATNPADDEIIISTSRRLGDDE